MTALAEDLLLLLLDDTSGKPLVDSTRLDRALAGAVLLELALGERIRPAERGEKVRKGHLIVLDAAPLGDTLLDAALAQLSGKPMKPERAIEKLAGGLRSALLERLAGQGLVRAEHRKVLGLFDVARYPAVPAVHEQQLRNDLALALLHGGEPAPRTAALVSLLAAVDAVTKVVPAPDRRAVKRRAQQIADGDWAGQAVRAAVDAVNGALVVAVTVAGISATSA